VVDVEEAEAALGKVEAKKQHTQHMFNLTQQHRPRKTELSSRLASPPKRYNDF